MERRLLRFSALKMENKEHNGQEQNEGHGGMPALWYVLFHAKRLHRCM